MRSFPARRAGHRGRHVSDSGHHLAEEAPEQLAAVLGAFLATEGG
ncbi:hypothetical protein [Micromonospora sp. U56]|nr:hypothetical protein [Micromonospora sp. U56]